MGYDATDRSSILSFARKLEGRPLGDSIPGLEETRVSGGATRHVVGHAIERYFDLPPNSEQRPDFEAAGIELKVVPLKLSRQQRTAKERTVITAINFAEMIDTPFGGSHLHTKTRQVLFVFFDQVRDAPMGLFVVRRVTLWRPDGLAEMQLDGCYGYVRLRVMQGRAHEITESATTGVGACTKGSSGTDLVAQPIAGAPLAMRRAFAFKAAFTTEILRGAPAIDAPFGIADAAGLLGVQDRLVARLEPFIDQPVEAVAERIGFDLATPAKSWLSALSRDMLGLPRTGPIHEFDRMGVTPRTIRLSPGGMPYEDVSFPAMDFLDIIEQDWESSDLLEQVSRMLFLVFEGADRTSRGSLRLRRGCFWEPDLDELATMGREWTTFQRYIRESRPEDAPKASQTRILHIRPKARVGGDTLPLPNGRRFVKSSFWLNRRFVAEIVARA